MKLGATKRQPGQSSGVSAGSVSAEEKRRYLEAIQRIKQKNLVSGGQQLRMVSVTDQNDHEDEAEDMDVEETMFGTGREESGSSEGGDSVELVRVDLLNVPEPIPVLPQEEVDIQEVARPQVLSLALGMSPWTLDLARYEYPKALSVVDQVRRACDHCGCEEEFVMCSICKVWSCVQCLPMGVPFPWYADTMQPWSCLECAEQKAEDVTMDRIFVHYLGTGYSALKGYKQLQDRVVALAKQYRWDHGRAVMLHQRAKSTQWLIIPPVSARSVLVAAAHGWGHTGRNRLVKALNTTFWWKGLTLMVKTVVDHCLPCKQARMAKIQVI